MVPDEKRFTMSQAWLFFLGGLVEYMPALLASNALNQLNYIMIKRKKPGK